MVRYGILGFGHHAVKRLAPAFAQAKTSKLLGLWRRDGEKAQANAREFRIPHCFATAEALCASEEIDAVFVVSPDALHREHALLAFKAGKPVLCEKPAAMNVAEVEEMLAAARKAGAQFGVAQNFRYNRSVRLIRDWIAQGNIGKPVLAAAQFSYLAAGSPRKWIYDPKLACGGPIGDVGIHCIDALRFVLADEVGEVAALAAGDTQPGAVESGAVVALAFNGGAMGSVSVTAEAAYRSLIEITGEDGVIASENGLTVDHPVDVVLRRNGKLVLQEQVRNSDGYSLMLDAFSAAISGAGAYAAPGDDALRNQRILDAAYRSRRSGCKESAA